MQDFSQLISGCEKSRLNCLFRDIQDLANVVIAAVMEMPQHNDSPLIHLHRHQCALDLAAQFGTAQQVIRQRVLISHSVVDLPGNSPAIAQVDGFIERDPVYPAEKLALKIKIFEMAEGLEKNILRNIACIFPIVEQSVSHVENRLLIPAHQVFEGIPATSK